MAKCGNCHETGVTVAHVRECYAQRFGAMHLFGPGSDGFSDRPRNWNVDSYEPANDTSAMAGADNSPMPTKTGTLEARRPGEHLFPELRDTATDIPASSSLSALREEAKALLVRKERGGKVGYFAIRTDEVVKFYRLRAPQSGRWAGYLFVDGQGSDEYYPVRATTTLGEVLRAITAYPEAAALLYATELGRCSRCGRTLTDETSRAVGMGPECRSK